MRFPSNPLAGDVKIQTYSAMVGTVYYINEVMSVYRLHENSLTHQRQLKDKKSSVNWGKTMINWYKDVDNYTNLRYHDIINQAIIYRKATIYEANENYFMFWNPKYWSFLFSTTRYKRIGIIIGMIGLPFLSNFAKRIKRSC